MPPLTALSNRIGKRYPDWRDTDADFSTTGDARVGGSLSVIDSADDTSVIIMGGISDAYEIANFDSDALTLTIGNSDVPNLILAADTLITLGHHTSVIGTLTVSDLLSTKEFRLTDTVWDDSKFPATGVRIDSSSTRYSYNVYNGTVVFNNNARYPNEPISMMDQMPHKWKAGTSIRPHIHWFQQSANEPNWLILYKLLKKDTAITIETDFTNHIALTKSHNAFTYVSGTLDQITAFPEIDMTGYALSDMIHYVLFRDTTNASGEFAGADPSSQAEHLKEFDVHLEIDSLGSEEEFVKN